jgi:hypothetical protein
VAVIVFPAASYQDRRAGQARWRRFPAVMGISVAQLGCFCKGVSMAARLLQSFKSNSFFRWRWEIGAYLPMTKILRCQPGAACAFSDTARGYSRSENHRLPPFDMPPGSAKKIIQQIQIFAQL